MSTFTPEIYKRFGTSVSIDLSSLEQLRNVREGVETLKDQVIAAQDAIAEVDRDVEAASLATIAQVQTAKNDVVQRIDAIDVDLDGIKAIDGQVKAIDTRLINVHGAIGHVDAQLTSARCALLEQFTIDRTLEGEHFETLNTRTGDVYNEVTNERALAERRHCELMNAIGELWVYGTAWPLIDGNCALVIREILAAQMLLVDAKPPKASVSTTSTQLSRLTEDVTLAQRLADACSAGPPERSKLFWDLCLLTRQIASKAASSSAT